MKIALCYSGKPCWKLSWDNRSVLESHALSLAASEDIEIHVFAHFWDADKFFYGKPEHELNNEIYKNLSNSLRNKIKIKTIFYERPKSSEFLRRLTFKDGIKREGRNPMLPKRNGKPIKNWQGSWAHNAISMFYSLEKSINLALELEREEGFKYDFIFRLRTDTVLLDAGKNFECPLNQCNGSKLNIAPYYWEDLLRDPLMLRWRPNRWNSFRGDESKTGCLDAIDDTFAFGNGKVMKKYASVYSNFFNLTLKNPTCQECMLGIHVKESNLEIEKLKWIIALINKDREPHEIQLLR